MGESCSCSFSHWWHAPIYLSLSLVLAAIAITSPPSSSSSSSSSSPSSFQLPHGSISLINASSALRWHGFSIMATLLQFSPDIFLSNSSSSSSSSSSTTVFAIPDEAISNISAPPSAMKLLLQYHTLPSSMSLQQLLLKPPNTCLPTSLPSKNILLTRTDPVNRLLQINNVPVSHPDLFLDPSLSIHGLLDSLSPLHIHSPTQDFIQSPPCHLSRSATWTAKSSIRPEYSAEWVRMMRVLSTKGFVSFAIGLNSVLDGILNDNPELGPTTVFVPPEFDFVSSSGPVLDRVVRYHIVGDRYSYSQLASLPNKAHIMTLLKGEVLEVTSPANGSGLLGINGVYVVSPDIFATEMLAVHAISTALDLPNHANS